jgi:hypothetical protein
MSNQTLISGILQLSVSKVWEVAKYEWTLDNIYFAEEPETCLCGQFPIIEVCTIRNKKNGEITEVGNVCVKKFLGLPSDNIFKAVKKLKADIENSINVPLLEHAYNQSWITDWENNFYTDIIAKRSLSQKQVDIKARINRKILQRVGRK